MSNPFKSIGRVFKKVFKAVKTVLPIALAAGAIIFTAGSALGLPALAGGWGGAVSSGLSSLGISGTGALGSILTGAATQAGYGAAIGGIGSMATGGDFARGAGVGALTGAVTGGVSGAMNAAPGMSVSTRSPNGLMPGNGVTSPIQDPSLITGPADAGGASVGAAGNIRPMPRPSDLTQTNAGGGFWSGLGNFAQTSGGGYMLAGLGQGLMQGMAAKDEMKADKQAQQRITDSYDVGPGAYDTTTPDTTARPDPEAKWGRPTATRRGRVRYDPASRQIVDVA